MTAGATRLVVGCMTGTSIDGLDAALVRIEGRGLSMRATVEAASATPLNDLSAPLRALADQSPMSAGAMADVARRFGLLHARAVRELLAGRRADLVVVHGQTVFHAPP
ncbi:MAG: anhydro-N-acetylmuramic acid kinase, partial [Phycisphaerae bacterium]|nr:anhydro-N-acetylmuramic acid kinase [Phycisphaerae bacterium]